tara:strand:+ start:248 stop:901 length:654 start_codon:yes stop_codon:yes gene_type:complete
MQNDKYYSYIFDCDGVILDSNKLKTECFRELLVNEEKSNVERFIDYHVSNQGINRYEKLRYFFEKIRKVENYENEYHNLLKKFTKISFEKICNCNLTKGIERYLKSLKSKNIKTYIVSGSDENELVKIFERKNILHFFNEVYGSPKSKEDIIFKLIKEKKINNQSVFFGDAKHDYQVASQNNISFIYISDYSDWKDGKSFCVENNILQINNFADIKI